MRAKAISAKKKIAPSGRVLARAFAKQKVEASKSVLARAFTEKNLEGRSAEGANAWFKKTVTDAFKKWHVHKDGSTPQVRIIGQEDFSSSQSGLEKSLASVKASTSSEAPQGYEIKGKAAETPSGTQISYKLGEEKGTGVSYNLSNAGASYNISQGGGGGGAHQYSSDSGVNVQCSCGLVAHAGMQKQGSIGFSPIGGADGGANPAYSSGGQASEANGKYKAGAQASYKI